MKVDHLNTFGQWFNCAMTGSNFLSKIFRINLRHSFEMLINKASRLSLKNWQTARILKFCVGTYVKLCVFHRKNHHKIWRSWTHFMSLVSFYIPWKHQKIAVFLTFSGGIERDQWSVRFTDVFRGIKREHRETTLKQIFHDLLVCCLF